MFKHNIILAFRNFQKDKSTFLINLIGLSIGLTCSLLIMLWVWDEWNMDRFHDKNSQLFHAATNHHHVNNTETFEYTPALLSDALIEEFPEIEKSIMASPIIPVPMAVSNGEKKSKGSGMFAGSEFFNLFSYEILEGDKNTMLTDKNSIVISDQLAEKIFGNESAVGKILNWELHQFGGDATVTGVFKKIGNNSSQKFDLVLTKLSYEALLGETIKWDNFNAFTYVRINENTDVKELNNRLSNFIKDKIEGDYNVTLFLKPFADNYLYGKYENGKQAGGRIEYLKLFSIIALFILLIACINFMNLSTAKATKKLKEIGVRKTIGASRQSLIGQYLGESVLTSLLALCTSILMVLILLPNFNLLADKQLSFPWQPSILVVLILFAVVTGIFAGSYPALYLSKFDPVKTLKGSGDKSSGGAWVRKGLVIFQFGLSMIFIVAVSIVYQQIEFVQNKNLGYNRNNIITFPKEGKAVESLETFLNELRNINGIIDASSTQHSIVAGGNTTTGISWDGKNPNDAIKFSSMGVQYDFLQTLEIELLEGNTFSKQFSENPRKLILNETAVKVMGLSEPIGETIRLWGDDAKIIGVVKDFHHESLHKKVEPIFIHVSPDANQSTIVARIEAGKERETLSRLEAFYKTNNPGYDLEYNFLDTAYDAEYKAEARVSALSRYFAGLAIFISCLGLFGLAAFTVQRRMKEISIRKVLGASVLGLVQLLSKNFLMLVLFAFLIATPFAYFLMDTWLNGFAYRIDIQWFNFIIAGIVIIGITFLIVSFHIVKAVLVNPMENLKSEE